MNLTTPPPNRRDLDLWLALLLERRITQTHAGEIMDSLSSNSHGNLDEQISQLMQCKPLNEQEVPTFCLSFFYFFFLLLGISWNLEIVCLYSGGVGWFRSNVMDPAWSVRVAGLGLRYSRVSEFLGSVGTMCEFGYLGDILRVDLAVGLLEIWLFGQDLCQREIDPLSWCHCSWPLKFQSQHYLAPRLFSQLVLFGVVRYAKNVSVLFLAKRIEILTICHTRVFLWHFSVESSEWPIDTTTSDNVNWVNDVARIHLHWFSWKYNCFV